VLKKIKILGCEFRVTRDVDTRKYLGYCCVNKQHIKVAKGIHPKQAQAALIHEVLEALNSMLRLGMPHRTIVALETGLNAVVQDNPKLLDLWRKK